MRALLIVLDSVGIGNAPDAESYGDGGANTLGHILEKFPELQLPHLYSLGLPELLAKGGRSSAAYTASFGRMRERSAGKDTATGHWEIAGVVLKEPFAVFERFPTALVEAIEREAGVHFIGNYARSGTAILEELGAEHLRTSDPILYTSADSVLQIAAHEEVISVARLYQICEIARRHADQAHIGRVIARPFIGEIGNFQRTARRHDYSLKPSRTILDALSESGTEVIGVGKISDTFADRGVTRSFRTANNSEGMRRIAELWPQLRDGLIFANLVDFDTLFGHRRDVEGYARALEEFDGWLGSFLLQVQRDDLLVITADHGNDPTMPGTDHTREEVPLFVQHGGESRDLGTRATFADVAATLAHYFELKEVWPTGATVLPRV